MKRTLTFVAALGLVAWQGIAWAGDAEEMTGACLDCHELSEFAGMSADELATAAKEASANDEMMAETMSTFSDEELQAIYEYIAAHSGE